MPFGRGRRQNYANGLKHPNAKEVRVSILFTRLGEIDTINERFSCEATLFITWRESINILQKCESQGENSYIWDSSKLWDPQLYIDNAIGDVKEKDVKFRLEKVFDDAKNEWFIEVHMIKRIQGMFFEKLELYHFPFDVQADLGAIDYNCFYLKDLSLTLTSHRTLDEIVVVQDYNIPPKMTKSASLDKHIWQLYDHVNVKMHTIRNDLPPSSNYSNEEFDLACSHSALTMQCRVSRKPGYFIINCLLPTLMITLCVFFTFLMDYQRFQYRFSLLFTTILTSITFRWAIHGRVLPTISYMTFLDVYCVSSIMIVFSAMIWHAAYLVLYKQDEKLAERCDTYAIITFAILVLIVHIVQTIWFIIAFKKRLDLEQLDKIAALNYTKARMSSATPLPQLHIGSSSMHMSKVNSSTSLSADTNKSRIKTVQSETQLNNANSSSNVKSKRMLYSLSKMEDNSIITIHNNHSNEANRANNEHFDDNKTMKRQESNSTCATTLSSLNTNRSKPTSSNLVLISKSSSFLNTSSSSNGTNTNSNTNPPHSSYVCNSTNMYAAQASHNAKANTTNSLSIKEPFLDAQNKLNVASGFHNNQNSLHYQHIPLLHQSTKNS